MGELSYWGVAGMTDCEMVRLWELSEWGVW